MENSFPEDELFPIEGVKYIKFDDYDKPNTFLVGTVGALMSYSKTNGSKVLLGKVDELGNLNGSALDARITFVSELIQYNKTKWMFADFLNHCVREYDSEKNIVRTFFGLCGVNVQTLSISVDSEAPPQIPLFMGVLGLAYLREKDYWIAWDQITGVLVQMNPQTNTVRLHDIEARNHLNHVWSILPTIDESLMYILHGQALSEINMTTLETKKLIGNPNADENSPQAKLTPGTFDEAIIGLVAGARWAIPDKIIIAGTVRDNEAIVTMDLLEKKVKFLCQGKQSFIYMFFSFLQ